MSDGSAKGGVSFFVGAPQDGSELFGFPSTPPRQVPRKKTGPVGNFSTRFRGPALVAELPLAALAGGGVQLRARPRSSIFRRGGSVGSDHGTQARGS